MREETVTGVVSLFFRDDEGKLSLNGLVVLGIATAHGGSRYTTKSYYDVDHSKEFGYLYHMSGAGGEHRVEVRGLYFVEGKATVKKRAPQWVGSDDNPPWKGESTRAIRQRNPTQALEALPDDLQGEENVLSWLQSNAIESDSVWCSICADCFPGSNPWDLCEHCWWCDATGTYSTPDDRCGCKNQAACRGDDDGDDNNS